MSGLKPFRPRKPEREVHPPLPNAGQDGVWPSRAPPNRLPSSVLTNSSYPAAPLNVGSLTNSSATPHGQSVTPPESSTSDADDSQMSDDQSLPDPFRKSSHMSDNDVDEGEDLNDDAWKAPYLHRSTPAPDRHHPAFSIAPHPTSLPPGDVISTPTTPPAPSGGHKRTDSSNRSGSLENQKNPGENTMNATPSASVPISAHRGMTYTGSGIACIPGQHTVAPSSEFETGSKLLAVRPANRDKKPPPPPPKSHHGKLINPSPHATSSQPQGVPPRPTKRFSYHGTSSETSLSLTPDTPPSRSSQPRIDYFTPLHDNPAPQSAETLRRSQSQHKRPPTPPLSRRHSQMRRSKSTMSRTNLSRLSMPAGKIEVNASPPSSPGPQAQEPRTAPPMADEAEPDPGQREPPLSRRASQVNPLPPPPPPRRNRVSSNHSNSRSQSAQKKQAEDEDFIPRPSNANDILADLSRLQKEVDDLRGHYESRKVSH
ncbi:hypothetical protein BA78_4533 [Aspergillus fumigatus]|nr:hypothetical protein BA78_4533 [Aspergillus fumigatus]